MNSERKQRLVRIVVVIAIAVGAGHVAQSNTQPKVRFASLIPDLWPASVGPVAAATPDIAWREPTPDPIAPPRLPADDLRPAIPQVSHVAPPGPRAELDCTPELSLSPSPGAMINARLSAPCHPETRVVMRHAGLAVTYATDKAGILSVTLPALVPDATVSALFAGGNIVEAAMTLPEAARHQRFGVQWMGGQSFGVDAFENGGDFGLPGHVSAANTQGPADGMMPSNGFLTLLGDDSVENPMLAQVYTFPAGAEDIPVIVEAAITEATCGREILGETIASSHGAVKVADLSVTMPGCDAKGDYLVLKNLVPDLKLAAAN